MGTDAPIVVAVAELSCAEVRLNLGLSFVVFVSKFVPVIVTAVPDTPIVGVKLVIVGSPLELVTIKEELLVAVPAGDVTEIFPVVAVAGTLVTSVVAVAEVMVAATPLNFTLLLTLVVLNPVPFRVTVEPIGPLVGVNSMMEIDDDAFWEMPRMLPAAS